MKETVIGSPFRRLAFTWIILLISGVLPFFLPLYWRDVLFLFVINVLVVMSYRLIITMGGWSFSHIAVMGLGGYTLAMLTTKHYHLSFWLAFPLGGIASALFAFIISFAVFRTKGFYFFLSTFAAGEALRQAFIQFRDVFGGLWGIPFIQRPAPFFGFDFQNNSAFYYVILITTILSGFILYRLDQSRIGRTIKALAEDDALCESFGVNTWGYKAAAHVVGSFFAGIAGVLFAGFNGFVAPTDFTS
ncbi:MAG: branched-chain amino acid ABC transporter permease, partial [Thermodesulfobacteriota bacterium]